MVCHSYVLQFIDELLYYTGGVQYLDGFWGPFALGEVFAEACLVISHSLKTNIFLCKYLCNY